VVPDRVGRAHGRGFLAPLSSAATRFSIIVPTRGEPATLLPLLDALARQTLPRDRFEILISFDGVEPGPEVTRKLAAIDARAVRATERRGPGAARNRAAREATGEYLAFTEDDCLPSDDWLERADARLTREPALDVLEGATIRPDGGPTRRPDRDHLHYLPTNLFVRRAVFESTGGYSEEFFLPGRGIYFREDSDFGFTLEEGGASTAREVSARVTHPFEHVSFFDPLRWARRYELDPLLQARHPDLFRERIEVHRLGPLTFRRLFVRACNAYVIALLAALLAAAFGDPALASAFVVAAGAAFLPIWAKWGFNPLRLPVLLVVPFVLVGSMLRGTLAQRRDEA
jgi:glycosyltransferase involved in cell wall biosynthesis